MKLIPLLIFVLISNYSFCQAPSINKLYDYDSSGDRAYKIFIQSHADSTASGFPDAYFLIGSGASQSANATGIVSMKISAQGQKIRQSVIMNDSCTYGLQSAANSKKLSGNRYLVPLSVQNNSVYSSGFAILNANGDSVLVKQYNDPNYSDLIMDCDITSSNNYLFAGFRKLTGSSTYRALLECTDSLGNIIWSNTYPQGPSSIFNSVQVLSNTRFLIGGSSNYVDYNNNLGFPLGIAKPWFIIMDTLGNIIKDTVYSTGYAGGGQIWKDLNGGYFHIGTIDTFDYYDINNRYNFPPYIAHLDTAFHINWITKATDDTLPNQIWRAKQLSDSSYLLVGNSNPNWFAWAEKISKTGALTWHHYYTCPGNNQQSLSLYLDDIAEKSDGTIALVGQGLNDSFQWRGTDFWLLTLDKNGQITNVKELNPGTASLKIYPNPSTGNISIESSANGILYLYTTAGQKFVEYKVLKNKSEFTLPAALSTGMYLCRFVSENGEITETIRLLYTH